MRADVDADLATSSTRSAAESAMNLFEADWSAALEKEMRRMVRHAVEVFKAHQAINLIAAGPQPQPGQPIRVPPAQVLLDQAAAQAQLAGVSGVFQAGVVMHSGQAIATALGLSFNVANPLLQGVIASQAGMNITTAPQHLIGTMMQSLQTSYDTGASIPNAASAMRQAGYAQSQSYAVRIARTEIIGASNGASLALAAHMTNLPYKRWMAHHDDRTRETHRAADGQVVGIHELFGVGIDNLAYPGDPNGSPGEIIHCRCTLGYQTQPPSINTIANMLGKLARKRDRGGEMAAVVETTDETTEPAVGASWSGIIAQEGVDTGDGRRIEPGALNWRELPLTLMSQLVTPEFGGHTDAEVAGRIDTITRAGQDIPAVGVFDTGEHGSETERMVRDQMLRGISVDLAINEAEIIPDPDIEDEIEAYFMGTLNVLDGTILGATVVPFPAFESASIAIVAGAAMHLHSFRKEEIDGERKTVVSFYMPFTPTLPDPVVASGAGDLGQRLDEAIGALEAATIVMRDVLAEVQEAK